MLENDLVLTRFLDAFGDSLTEDDVARLDVLLDMSDDVLWELFSGRREVDDPALASFLARLRAA
jgi:antitoxin CptB